jgi:HK97 family phage portal protein
MSKRNRVRSSRKAQPRTQKDVGFGLNLGAYAYSHTIPYWSGEADLGRDDWGRSEAYKLVGTVNRCVDLLSQAVNDLDWHIVRDSDGTDEIVSSSEDRRPRHPAAQAIHEVFADQGTPLFSLWVNSRNLYGETYIEKRINAFESRRQITWLYPYWCEPETGTGRITGYRYGDKNGQSYEFLLPDVVAFDRTHNPTDGLRGLSKIDTALPDINGGRELKRFIKWTLANNARPGLILSPQPDAGSPIPSQLLGNDITLLEKQMADQHVGTQNAHTALISPKPLNVTTLEGPELDKYRGLMEEFKKDVCITFGVPLAMAGDSSSTTFKDGPEVRRAFYINTVIPLAHLIQDFFNAKLMPFLDPDGECTFQFDTAEFEDSTVSERAVADLINVRLQGSYLTLNEARIAQGLEPLSELEGLVIVGGVPTPLARIGQPAAVLPSFRGEPSMPDTSRLEIQAPETPQLSARAGQSSMRLKATESGDYCILAPLPNNPAIQTVQDTLRGLIGEAEWQTPDTFHLTLCYATGTPEQTDTVSLDGSVQALITDSVDQFDTPEGYAIHLKVRPTAELVAYQAGLVEKMRAAGMTVSDFSDTWQPHITLCYAAQPITPFAITPIVLPMRAVDVSNDAYEVIGTAVLKQSHTHDHPSYEFPKALPLNEWREKALNELKAWQRHEKAGKARAFVPVYTAHLLDEFVNGPALEGSLMVGKSHFFDYAFAAVRYEPFEVTKAFFVRLINEGLPTTDSVKAWSDTKQEFEDEILLTIDDARSGTLTQSAFEGLMKRLIRSLGEQAYLDGLSDGGVDGSDLGEEGRKEVDDLIVQQDGYAAALATQLYSAGISDAQFDRKPEMWVNKTLTPFYQAGLAAADANALFEWKYGDTEHCEDCLRLNGQRHRMKDWVREGWLPQSNGTKTLACQGYNCKCSLILVRGRSRGDY